MNLNATSSYVRLCRDSTEENVSVFIQIQGYFYGYHIPDIYDVDIQTIGIISGIPEFSGFIIRPFFARFIDYLRSKPDGYGIGKVS